MVGYREMQNPPSFVVQHHEHPQDTKGHRRHREEVHADQGIPMVAQKDQPALELVGRSAPPGQISGHRTLINLQAQLQQFAMNPRRSPTILTGHPSDELLHLPRNTRASCFLGPGHPPPE